MNFVLVFPLTLTFLSTAVTQQLTNSSCYAKCSPGYYKIGDCDDPVGWHRCGKCPENSYTDKENSRNECFRCSWCGHYEKEIKQCTFNSNTVCDCEEDHYNRNSRLGQMDCQPCSSERCEDKVPYPDYQRKCLSHPRCTKCGGKKKCPTPKVPPDPSENGTTSPSPPSFVANNTSNPFIHQVPSQPNIVTWLFLVACLVTLLVIFLVIFLVRLLHLLVFSRNKVLQTPAELTRFNDQNSRQGSSPETMVSNIEEAPMITVSQSPETPEIHISPADDEHKADRQDEPSEHWPAIVLYAIIKEVPLRRWKEFLRLLSVADQQLERVELEAGLGLGSMERQYQMLRLWSQRTTASMEDVFSALHYMDLSGCAQLLQESLERLQGRPELNQGSTACRGYTDQGFNGTMQDT